MNKQQKFLRGLKGFGLSILFVIVGIYLINTENTLFNKIVGVSCIIFFGGLLLFAFFKLLKNNS